MGGAPVVSTNDDDDDKIELVNNPLHNKNMKRGRRGRADPNLILNMSKTKQAKDLLKKINGDEEVIKHQSNPIANTKLKKKNKLKGHRESDSIDMTNNPMMKKKLKQTGSGSKSKKLKMVTNPLTLQKRNKLVIKGRTRRESDE